MWVGGGMQKDQQVKGWRAGGHGVLESRMGKRKWVDSRVQVMGQTMAVYCSIKQCLYTKVISNSDSCGV